jgi:DNA-binding winged helix-turn-helix (wHTH) protein
MQMQSVLLKKRREQICPDASAMIGSPASPAQIETIFEFGRFQVLPRSRKLLVNGVPVDLGTRAFDLLMVLIEADGVLMTKDELLARVWPSIFVDDTNLKVQISALRKALGEDRGLIRTENGRGYRFTAAIRSTAAAPPGKSALLAASEAMVGSVLLAIASRLVCLEAKVDEALSLTNRHRTGMPAASAACVVRRSSRLHGSPAPARRSRVGGRSR